MNSMSQVDDRFCSKTQHAPDLQSSGYLRYSNTATALEVPDLDDNAAVMPSVEKIQAL